MQESGGPLTPHVAPRYDLAPAKRLNCTGGWTSHRRGVIDRHRVLSSERKKGALISVIIPVLDESSTVGYVVEFAWANPQVTEVIVVDDGSIDGTPEVARTAGARVVTSTFLGKGASMEDGLRVAGNDVVLYLDGDLRDLGEDLIMRMTRPIFEGEADFVKAKFTRAVGPVTILTARPLLDTFFPELATLGQPFGRNHSGSSLSPRQGAFRARLRRGRRTPSRCRCKRSPDCGGGHRARRTRQPTAGRPGRYG